MSDSMVGKFCWNELATSNVKSAKEFYGKLLGWEFTEHNMGDTTYTMIKSGEKEFGGIWQIPTDKKNDIPPHWMGYILVEDVEEIVKKAETCGASIKVPVTPAGDMGHFAVIIDPTGAHIAFWESNK
jgi:uncharacterized protein